MSDTRRKNVRWELPEQNSWEVSTLAVLMDIRDELQTLVRIFQCSNFQGIPWDVKKLVVNTRKPKRKPKLKIVKRRAA